MQGLKEAIKRRRASKIDETSFQQMDGLMDENKKRAETGLAPEIQDRGVGGDSLEENPMESQDEISKSYEPAAEKGAVEDPNELEQVGQKVQLEMNKPKSKQQELDNLSGMYDEGDEKKRGFMGKAAMKMRERLSQIKK